jgi:6,7-dimethyl-8-ribityllumazine synthase
MPTTHEEDLDATGMRIAVVASRWNDLVASRLLRGAVECLDRRGVPEARRTILRVPGSWEIPLAARKAASTGRFDAVVALGVLVRGETSHFDVLAHAVAKGLADVALETGVPVGFGVLTAETLEQALERAGGKMGNKGIEAAEAAIEMVNLLRRIGS